MMENNQTVTKFEFLPNEIIIECFGYLNTLEMFSSFDQLNSRFDQLIGRFPLHPDFENSPQTISERFCQKMLIDPEMKRYIHSLSISNSNPSIDIRSFYGKFSLSDFPCLQSLTLTKVESINMDKLTIMLSSMPSLTCFRVIGSEAYNNALISSLDHSRIRTLTVSRLYGGLTFLSNFQSLTRFTINACSIHQVFSVLNNTSNLKYLQVNCLSNDIAEFDEKIRLPVDSLRHLVINETKLKFYDIQMILKLTPNLTHFTLFTYSLWNSGCAQMWEHVIHNDLPYLKAFKFCFQYFHRANERYIEEDLKKFQSDFWCNVHGWLTEYILSYDRAMIYTVPYEFPTLQLPYPMERYRNTVVNERNTFNKVTVLKIDADRLRRITFDEENIPVWFTYLCNVKHLEVLHECQLHNPLVMLQILKEIRQISSLTISATVLQKWWNNNELCQYLNQMIHKLCMKDTLHFSTPRDILEQFCKLFSNVQQLTCTVDRSSYVLFISTHLQNLIYANFTLTRDDITDESLQNGILRLGMNVHFHVDPAILQRTSISVYRNI
ncbi:unnamed protein product [Adineta ricciae]|uniref:F-box domain-containing protein n=1 Tax=Adineta ricciae TaxID=249248 RepID=A0A816CFR4_ADIRI|nr:unnamed protein product [Adineta ricciae]